MQLAAVRHIYEAPEPVATVYLEAQPVSPDAEHEVRLRWDSLRQQLTDAGTPQELSTPWMRSFWTPKPSERSKPKAGFWWQTAPACC